MNINILIIYVSHYKIMNILLTQNIKVTKSCNGIFEIVVITGQIEIPWLNHAVGEYQEMEIIKKMWRQILIVSFIKTVE